MGIKHCFPVESMLKQGLRHESYDTDKNWIIDEQEAIFNSMGVWMNVNKDDTGKVCKKAK